MVFWSLFIFHFLAIGAPKNRLRFCAVVAAPSICSYLIRSGSLGDSFPDTHVVEASHLTALIVTHYLAPPDLPDCDFHGLVIFAEYLGKTSIETLTGIFMETEILSRSPLFTTLLILALRGFVHSDLLFPGRYVMQAAPRPWVLRRPRIRLQLI